MVRQLFRFGSFTLLLAMALFWLCRVAGSGHDKDKPADSKAAFLVLPYLQLPTTTGMTVMWETNQRLPSHVEYGRTLDLERVVADPNPVILHELRLSGLEAGAKYYYRV